MLSHRSAAAHCDLLGGEPRRVEVTAPSTRRGVAQVRLHRSRSLGARDATSHEGIPVTTIARSSTVNHPLAALGDAPIEVDFHWPSHRLVVETDGWEFHRTSESFERDRRRDAALIASGHTVMRFTWREIRDRPDVVATRLRALVR